jgi:hypothetical protein
MKIKTSIAVISVGFMLFALSNKAVSQTTNTALFRPSLTAAPPQLPAFAFHPSKIAAWQDKSGDLPGITSDGTVRVVVISLGVVTAAVVALVLVHNHKRHHLLDNNTTLINPNFDINLAFCNNLKGVGVRYAFK